MIKNFGEIESENINIEVLLKKFNDRDSCAFAAIYEMLYNDLYYFTNKVYANTDVEASDIIHDTFTNIWTSKIKFKGTDNVKAYCFTCIKNKFKNHICHLKYKKLHIEETEHNSENLIVAYIAETEFLSIISHALALLPSECSKVFKLYVEGWSIKDIAEKLGKSESTVYSQKTESIRLLKVKLPKDFMYLFKL